jgi:AraC family transcriptional regulator
LAKIADLLDGACHQCERLGTAPALRVEVLAETADWAVEDVLCTHRQSDPAFEERHERYRIALVGAGMFRCRAPGGRELLTPGSLLLGNAQECFECDHEHGGGDRCLAFAYSPESFEQLAFEAGVRGLARFRALRVPPLRALAPLVAETCTAWKTPRERAAAAQWEELGVRLAAATVRIAADPSRAPRAPLNAERGVARALRLIEKDPCEQLGLQRLAREANLSRFHFLRAFAQVTGLPPHRYLTRARLRGAAIRLAATDARVIDVALDCGYRDVSNFNRAFRAEFGTTPLQHRGRPLSTIAIRAPCAARPR